MQPILPPATAVSAAAIVKNEPVNAASLATVKDAAALTCLAARAASAGVSAAPEQYALAASSSPAD